MKKEKEKLFCCSCGKMVGYKGDDPDRLKSGVGYICNSCQEKFKKQCDLLIEKLKKITELEKELKIAQEKTKAIDELLKSQNPFKTFGIKNPFG